MQFEQNLQNKIKKPLYLQWWFNILFWAVLLVGSFMLWQQVTEPFQYFLLAVIIFVFPAMIYAGLMARYPEARLKWHIYKKRKSLFFEEEQIKSVAKIWDNFKRISYKKAQEAYGEDIVDFLILNGYLNVAMPGVTKTRGWLRLENLRLEKN